MEIKKIRREIIDEIAQRKVVSSRGLSRERAVKRKMKGTSRKIFQRVRLRQSWLYALNEQY
jgi:hypothetical protein